MKKMLLITLVGCLSLSNCQRDNYNDYASGTPEQPKPKEMFNPPAWIYGSWKAEKITSKIAFGFSENHITYKDSQKPTVLQTMNTDPNIKSVKEEIISNTEYKFTVIKYGATNNSPLITEVYHFVKVSDSKIYFKTIGVNYVKL